MTIRLSDAELGARLDARRAEGFLVHLQPAEGAAYNQCHKNAELEAIAAGEGFFPFRYSPLHENWYEDRFLVIRWIKCDRSALD